MQRWMQAKEQRAKIVGTMVSGAGGATGGVMEDRFGRRPQDRIVGPIKERETERHGNRIVEVSPVRRKVRGTVMVVKAEREAGWNMGRKARRAAAFAK